MRIAHLFVIISAIVLSLAVFGQSKKIYAQESSPQVSEEVSRALNLYKSGDIQSAANVLRERVKVKADDADAWHYLGVILMKGGDLKSAIRSFQMAVKLRPNFTVSRTGLAYALLWSNNNKEAKRVAEEVLKLNRQSDEAHYILSDIALKEGDFRKALDEADAALEIQPIFKAALDVKQKALFVVFVSSVFPFQQQAQANGKAAIMALQIMTGFCCIDLNQSNIQVGDAIQTSKLAAAVTVFEKSIKRTPNLPETAEWQETLESLKFWRDYYDPEKHLGTSKQYDPKSVTTGARLISKPAPQFSKEDIKDFKEAKIVLRALVTETGKVKHIMVLRSLGYELTRKAIVATRQASFEPAKKDGSPVPVITLIEYDFKAMTAEEKK